VPQGVGVQVPLSARPLIKVLIHMTFLNPFVLFGLAAAAIPILIHLLNKRKLRTIEFSTLTFLKELQKNQMRKITIRQWLLLLLRMLMIIFLVLAFSRPALKGHFGTLGSHAKTSLLIILDNTASMELHNEKGKYLDQAKEKAQQVISLMQEGDDAAVIRLSELPVLTMQTLSHDKQKLQSIIEETSVSVIHHTVEDALRAGAAMLQQSKNFNKEVFILSDGQLTTLRSAAVNKTPNERMFEPTTKFYHFTLASASQQNVGIERITIPPTLLQVQKPVTVSAVIKNYGNVRKEHYLASMSIGGVRVMQKNISLDGGEQGTVEFSFTPARAGFITGYIELEDDEFEADNRRYFSLYIPVHISLLLAAENDLSAKYIETALTIANTAAPVSYFTIKRLSPAQLSTTAIQSSDVILFSGIKTIPPQQLQLLKHYIASGGSMIFFPSSDSLTVSYNYLNQFGIQQFHQSVTPPPGSQFDYVDDEFPIFTGMFEAGTSKKQSIESADAVRSLSPLHAHAIRPIMTLTNGAAFLWLLEFGNGKILGFSVPAVPGWSNFPLKGIFVPLLNQSVIYLASQVQLETLNKEYYAGETVEFTSSQIKKSKNSVAAPLRMVDPEQRMSPLKAYSTMAENGSLQTIFSGEPLRTTGHHYIIAERDTVLALSVNMSNEESDGNLASADDNISLLTSLGADPSSISNVAAETSLQNAVWQSRFGIELWRYFALAAVICAIIEMLVARENKTND
jgi:hypothetical protein